MILLLHILIALSGVIFSGYTFFRPAKSLLRASYSLVAATIASGTYLVITTHSPLTQSCLTGLIYLGVTIPAITAAQIKLARN